MTAPPTNLLADLPAQLPEEHFDALLHGKGLKLERIVSTGQRSPDGFWYDQPRHEWVMLLQGQATLSLQDPDETLHLKRGDQLLIPAHRRHRVDHTSGDEPTVWLALHYDPD